MDDTEKKRDTKLDENECTSKPITSMKNNFRPKIKLGNRIEFGQIIHYLWHDYK